MTKYKIQKGTLVWLLKEEPPTDGFTSLITAYEVIYRICDLVTPKISARTLNEYAYFKLPDNDKDAVLVAVRWQSLIRE